MKYIFIIFLSFIQIHLPAQVLDDAIEGLGQKKINEFSNFLDVSVEICINDRTEILDKPAAINKIRTFLNSINPTSVIKRHTGASKDASSTYKVVRLIGQEESYRVFFYLEQKSNKTIIKEIRFDKE